MQETNLFETKVAYMKSIREAIQNDFQGFAEDWILELEQSVEALVHYVTVILKPVQKALTLVDETVSDFRHFIIVDKNQLKKSHLSVWFQNASWNKIVERCVKDYETKLIYHARQKLKHPDLAQDVVQDTFSKLAILKSGEVSKDIQGWLYKTCQNRAFDLNKKLWRKVSMDSETLDSVFEDSFSKPDQVALINDDYRYLMQFLQKHLNETQLKLLKLKFEQQMSSKEIAGNLNLSENYVRKALCVTLMSIRKKLNHQVLEI